MKGLIKFTFDQLTIVERPKKKLLFKSIRNCKRRNKGFFFNLIQTRYFFLLDFLIEKQYKYFILFTIFCPEVSTFKSLQSFLISLFSLSLSLTISHSLSFSLHLYISFSIFSPLLRIYGRFRPCCVCYFLLQILSRKMYYS